ncbi:hypothetical protein D9613_009450 [Agrocybe pediades]|uniref:Uncharacterized protein n=1 Tax=Agrocybe pediades TaxID=84607 RepID=A0A8H4VW15_9AGAR|nr:hypothetical protein D9613_009450 [Agrocybe pediades]
MHEILRRSGGESPLHVFVVLRSYKAGEGYKEFVDLVLSKHWARVERLQLHFAGPIVQKEYRNHILSQLTRPAPSLCICHIEISPQLYPDLWQVTIGLSSPLFGNVTPNLRYLRCERLAIPTDATWLSGLTSFITTESTRFTGAVVETLTVLSNLPRLTYLELAHEMLVGDVVPEASGISSKSACGPPAQPRMSSAQRIC